MNILLAAALCATPWFPSGVRAMRYAQTTSFLAPNGEERVSRSVELRYDSFKRVHDELRFMASTLVQGHPPAAQEQRLRCTSAGLVPVNGGTPAWTISYEGVEFGSNLTPGSHWTLRSTTKAEAWTTSSRTDYEVEKREQVTVPAGTFDAFRVDYVSVLTSSQRGDLPPSKGSIWVVPGKGLIKQSATDAASGLVPQKTTIELLPPE